MTYTSSIFVCPASGSGRKPVICHVDKDVFFFVEYCSIIIVVYDDSGFTYYAHGN